MIQASEPRVTINDTLNACIDGIRDPELKQRLSQSESLFEQQSDFYYVLGKFCILHTIDPLDMHTSDEQCVINDLTKRELINLYDYYLRGKNKRKGRELYEKILISVTHCPFCGGLGERPNTIDHYLPKSLFPQFSILPLNLLPACGICNTTCKGRTFAETECSQIIHPVLDSSHFFNDQWILCHLSNIKR